VSTIAAVVRRHPIASFLAWSFTVGQAVAFLPVVLREVYDVEPAAQPFVVAANLVGLLLPALVITRIVDGPDGVRRLWSRALRVRTGLRWYALALVVVPSPRPRSPSSCSGSRRGRDPCSCLRWSRACWCS
jgi:hypothetical protein